MGEQVASVCDLCRKTVVKKTHSDNDGMVHFCSANGYGYLLLFVDVPKGKSSRATFSLADKTYCPACLLRALAEWLRASGVWEV